MNQQCTVGEPAFLRAGALAAVGGVVLALVQTAIDPSMPDNPEQAIRNASESNTLAISRLVDLMAFLLLLGAVAVASRALSAGRGAAWARAGLTFFTVSACSGAIATMTVGAIPDIGDTWSTAPAALKPGYVAAVDALDDVSGGIFAVSWTALGVFGLLFAVAILRSELFPRPLAWISAISGTALLVAIVIGVALQGGSAFLFLLLGLLLSYVVIVTIGVWLWRLARTEARPPAAVT